MKKTISRREALRGTLGAAAVSVSLPFLDCFLDPNGAALADTGAALPVVFGTWFQALAFNPGRWLPDTVGANYQNKAELQVFDPFKSRMNLISGMKYFLDGRPLETHVTGLQIATTGEIPVGVTSAPSLDQTIADVIGTKTRFRSIEVALDGSQRSVSRRAGSAAYNPAQPSPAALYARIFGPEFVDPNASDFVPDPYTLARRSVLSVVTDDRRKLMKAVGASDRSRLDEYFTSIRQMEQQLDLELQKPSPLPSCTRSMAPPATNSTALVTDAEKNNELFGTLLAHAVACGQTRIFNVNVGAQGMRRAGSTQQWHSWTHEEPVDPKLGYQPEVTWFIEWANQQFATFLTKLQNTREGAGNVLDRTLILWQTDHGYARTHTMENVPIITVGNANGKFKTGLHLSAPGDPTSRIGLTVQQAFGVPISKWGKLSNETSKTFTDILT